MSAVESTSRSVMLGKYRVIARLGTGGMAEVFLAVAHGAMNVNRLVVVKKLRDELASDPASREMFLDEARLAARLNHPNVIQTFEAGSEGGTWFLAMEYVEGQPFSRVLSKMKKEDRVLPPKMAARIVADALNGLHYAHELTDFDGTPLSIVHRDVSPQNMMITYGGVSKIVDFGIAKAAGSTQTAHGVFKGKVAFMAPEQVLGESIDGRADVFAAGIVLWEALSGGAHLFASDTPARTLYNLMNKTIPRVAEINEDVPAALDTIVARALERDVEKRYPTAKAMRDALEDFITASGGISSEAVGELVTDLFADRKKSVQAQVKGQLAALSLGRGSDPDINAVSKTHVRPAPAAVIDLSEASVEGDSAPSVFRVVTATENAVTSEIAPTPQPRTSKVAFGVLIAVTALALCVSALALHRAQTSSAPPPAIVTVTAPAPPPAATPLPPPVVVAETAAPPASATPVPKAAAAPVARPTPYPYAPKPATAPVDEPPKHPVTPAPSPPPAPAETARGRTFRRDL